MTAPRSGRVIVHTNQVPFETDILRTQMDIMANDSMLAQTILGTGNSNATLAVGLGCIPDSPADMGVQIEPGAIYQMEAYDATAFGVIPPDTADIIYKQGINWLPNFQLSGFLAPATPGDSVYYIVQAQLLTSDNAPVSRPYYNSSNPTSPIFNSEPDTRIDSVFLQKKSGIPFSGAPSPVDIPAPDAGFVGLWAILITFGQTSIVAGNISLYPNAPFITEGLQNKLSQTTADARYVSNDALRASDPLYYTDIGAVNALIVNPSPAYAAISVGSVIYVNAANTNTGAATINVSGLGIHPVIQNTANSYQPLVGGEIVSGTIGHYQYTAAGWALLNPSKNPVSFYQKRISTTQSIPNSSAFIALAFDTNEVTDSFGIITTTNAPNYRYIAGISGKYQISFSLYCITPNPGSVWVTLLKNGAAYKRLAQISNTTGTDDITLSGTLTLNLNATDNVSLACSQNTTAATLGVGTSDTTFSFFEITYIG